MESLSARRAWIEIGSGIQWVTLSATSLSARRAWIEIRTIERGMTTKQTSLSARRAWIEISSSAIFAIGSMVALRKESVD